MIIVLSSTANAGKDACSDYLCKKYGFVKIAFADKIKRIVMHLYQLDYDSLFGNSQNRSKIDPRSNKLIREFMQSFGDCGRSIYLNTWVDYTTAIIDKITNIGGYYYVNYDGLKWDGESKVKSVVVPDGRYLNELEAIRNMGGKLIRIIRPNSQISGSVAYHSSEKDQENIDNSFFDDVLLNNGTLEELYEKIDTILLKYKSY